jgi:hypothetical protein
LEGWELFKELCLENEVMKHLDVKSVGNAKDGVDYIVEKLIERISQKKDKQANLFHLIDDLTTKDLTKGIVKEVIENLKSDRNFVERVYKMKDYQESLRSALSDPVRVKKFAEAIQGVVEHFTLVKPDGTTKKTIRDVVDGFLRSVLKGSSGKCVVLNLTLYKAGGNLAGMRSKYVREILRQLYEVGLDLYRKNEDLNLNTLVVLEEAHNYAPKWTDDDGTTALSNEIVKYFMETRKFGIGWMCITTRPSNVRREVFDHSRVKFIGMGLTSGPDAELLKEAFGPEFLNIYRLFPDPSDPLSPKKEVYFAISGPITVLSRQSPDLITVFSSKEDFLKANWE